MRRFFATLRRDVILQNRYRFYAVSVVMVLFWGGLLGLILQTGRADEYLVVPAFVSINLIVTTFYFMAGMVLLERSEGMLSALVVTPLRDLEYFASKIVSLSVLGLVESLLIVFFLFGSPQHMLPLIAGTLVMGALFVLAGFISAAGYDAVNEWIMPSAVVITVMCLPLLPHFGITGTGVVWLHPLEPTFVLARGAYAPLETWQLAYGVAGSLLWLGIGLVWARQRFRRFVIEGG